VTTVGERAVARVARRVVEERERECETALGIDRDKASVADACDVIEDSRLDLLQAARAPRESGRCRGDVAGYRCGSPAVTDPFSSREHVSWIG
jgi:hypothetical protein